jgi:DnaJ-class molecular chaperone
MTERGEREASRRTAEELVWKQCPACEGKGQRGGTTCPYCEGTGQASEPPNVPA